MKSLKFFLLAVIAVLTGTAFDISSRTGRAGYTASPGELACNNCHNSFALNSGAGAIVLRTDLTNGNEYVPGQLYTITVVPQFTGRSEFGFGFEALNTSNQNAGTLNITNVTKTKALYAVIQGNSRKNIVHTGTGNRTADSADFTFTWLAPATNIGVVKFYYAAVCANSSNTNSGDYVYTGSFTVNPSVSIGINEPAADDRLICYYNNQTQQLIVKLNSTDGNNDQLDIYNLSGQKVLSHQISTTDNADGFAVINMSASAAGVYIVSLRTAGTIHGNRILIN